jgi:hypothetical protein
VPTPTPPQDKTAAIEPKPEVKPDAVAEAIDQPTAEAEPSVARNPRPRPKRGRSRSRPQAESAKAPDRKDADKPVKEASSKAEVRRQAVQRRRNFRTARQAEAIRRRRQALDAAGIAWR